MSNFDRFLAVAGFFRSSGYFKLRSELDNVDEIKILVGINVDEIFRKHNKALLMLAEPDKAKDLYKADFCDDVIKAEEFSKPKIVWAETMRRHKNTDERFPRFSYDINGVFLDKTCFMGIGADAEYIMVILNSRLGEFLCSKYVSILDNGGYLMQKVYLNEIPIIKAAEENKQWLLSLYKEPHNEELIDRIIFNQLNFTSEEIEYVEEYLLKQL